MHVAYYAVLGGIMLGYTMDDLDKMINAIHDAKLFYIKTDGPDKDMGDNLHQAISFLQGLWAEGYFD
jgi:hypothetical protein